MLTLIVTAAPGDASTGNDCHSPDASTVAGSERESRLSSLRVHFGRRQLPQLEQHSVAGHVEPDVGGSALLNWSCRLHAAAGSRFAASCC